jgi:hypothetical protein
MQIRSLFPVILACASVVAHAAPLGTAFTYQGQLKASGEVATGLYDFEACLFDSPGGPTALVCATPFDNVPVEDGVFTIELDFGAAFAGQERYLELRVRPGDSVASHTALSPRQLIRPAPEALHARALAAAAQSGLPGISVIDDPVNSVGESLSLAVPADGLPVMSYWDSTAGALKVAKCVDAACRGTPTVTVVDDEGNIGRYSSIAIGADGLPIISYIDQPQAILRVAKCQDAACTSTTRTTIADLAGSSLFYSAIAVPSDGLPVIAFQANSALRVAKCSNASCTGALVVIPDNGSGAGEYVSLAIGADDLPLISYSFNNALRVLKCGLADCSGTNTIANADDPANSVGTHTATIISASGRPMIAYRDNTLGGVKFMRCGDAACSSGNFIVAIPTSSGTVYNIDLALGPDGMPVISYFNSGDSAISVVRCANTQCNFGLTTSTIEGGGQQLGGSHSITLGQDGLPIIAYQTFYGGSGGVKFAKCGTRSCL